jgi:hypothetical protein
MKTLELKDICGYLPYKLHVRYLHKYASNIIIGEWTELSRLFYKDWMPIVTVGGHTGGFEDFTPILRPLSDLYKTITHNGKEIIPIVECAKICYGSIKWEFTLDKFWEMKKGCAKSGTDLFFFFNNYNAGFKCYTFRHSYAEDKTVCNQSELYDYLHELKIDYRSLIDAGLAVSVYDLETNPYEKNF